ncbi:YfbM family protein [Longispora urticae]
MGINGQYLRLTPDELAELLAMEGGAAVDLAYEIADREPEDALPAEARYLTTHKAWHALEFFLRRVDFPVDIVYGETSFTEVDWGYGPARYLSPERVREAVAAMARTDWAALDDVRAADLAAAEIYPAIWDSQEAVAWVQGWFAPLVPYFGAAAEDGDAVVIWLS